MSAALKQNQFKLLLWGQLRNTNKNKSQILQRNYIKMIVQKNHKRRERQSYVEASKGLHHKGKSQAIRIMNISLIIFVSVFLSFQFSLNFEIKWIKKNAPFQNASAIWFKWSSSWAVLGRKLGPLFPKRRTRRRVKLKRAILHLT